MSLELAFFLSGIFKDLLPEKTEDKSRLGKINMDLGILKEGMWSLAKRTAPLKLRAEPWWDSGRQNSLPSPLKSLLLCENSPGQTWSFGST